MANTVLTWDDQNAELTGFKIRKGDKPVPDPKTLAEVGSVGPTVHEFTAPAGVSHEFYAVSAYNATQEVPAADQALAYPALIIPDNALNGIAQAIGAGGVGFGPYMPAACQGYPLGGTSTDQWLLDSVDCMATASSGRVFGFDKEAIIEFTASNRVASVTKVADMPAGTTWVQWAAPLPNNKIVIKCGEGYLLFDVATLTVTLAHAQRDDTGDRGAFVASLNKIVLAGKINGPNTNSFYFGVLDPYTWEIDTYELPGITGGIANSYSGMLMVSDNHVVYWPRYSDTPGIMSLSWDGSGNFTTALAAAEAYPNSVIGIKQGLPIGNSTFLAVGNSTVYLITKDGVTTTPLSTWAGSGASTFTEVPGAICYAPNGGLLLFDSEINNQVLFISADRTVSFVLTPTTSDFVSRELPVFLDGDVHLFPQYANYPDPRTCWRIEWNAGLKPPISWPGSFLASGYNRQGRQRY